MSEPEGAVPPGLRSEGRATREGGASGRPEASGVRSGEELTGPDRLRAALSGADLVAFAPLAWARLPEFLHVAPAGEFWLDVGTTQRLLGDARSVCAADACVVPLLPRLPAATAAPLAATAGPPDDTAGPPDDTGRPAGADPPGETGELVALPEVTATVTLLQRLADTGGAGLVAELPSLAEVSGLLPGAAREDVEDALTDLGRAGLEAGAQVLCVRGAPGRDVAATVDAIAPLADFYGATALGIDGQSGWAAGDCCPVGVLGRDGRWPELTRGVILTAGDVTEWWTPHDVRALLRERQEAG